MYTSQVADHISNPRNIGELENPSGVGDVTNQVCMDRIRLTIQVERATLIDARVKASGCAPTLAAASALTELIIGKSLTTVESLDRSDVTRSLGKLPPAKAHCAALAIDALRAALQDDRIRRS